MNFPVIDTHVHFWDIEHFRYPWLDDFDSINRTFLLDDFDKARNDVEISKIIFVQCECLPEQHLKELRWIESLAAIDKRIQGIVPWAPLEDGEKIADELQAISKNKQVKGIRRIIQFEPDIDFCIKPEFIRGVQILGEFDLHFEITVSCAQIPNAIKMVENCPDIKFILNHIGNPDIAAGIIDPWAKHINELARFNNVYCKVSGLATNAKNNWKSSDLIPYLDTVFQAFGSDRLMYAGDWPHALRATDYVRWFGTFFQYTKPLGPQALRKLFYENAQCFYRL